MQGSIFQEATSTQAVYTYRARTLRQALERVREELGAGAAVVAAHAVPAPSWWQRLAGRAGVEVRAHAGRPPARPAASFDRIAGVARHESLESSAHLAHRADSDTPSAALASTTERTARVADAWQRRLLAEGLPAPLASSFVRRALGALPPELRVQSEQLEIEIRRLLADAISVGGPLVSPPGQQQVVALVGATGVGKTTTLAKLAAHCALQQGRRVALVTTDTYRLGAVAQLREYADILGVPFASSATPQALVDTLQQFAAAELLLVDTGGRHAHDDQSQRELRGLLKALEPNETWLVHSAAAQTETLRQAMQRMSDLRLTGLVLSKLDECPRLGTLWAELCALPVPLRYVTNGQQVPHDLFSVDASWMVSRLLGDAT